jgi:hypothetical protein
VVKGLILAITIALTLAAAVVIYYESRQSDSPAERVRNEFPAAHERIPERREVKRANVPSVLIQDGSPRVELPAVVPGAKPGVVVSSTGGTVAIGRFYALLQDDSMNPLDVVAVPFLLDGREVLREEEKVQEFIRKARSRSLAKRRTNTVLEMRILPAGNTWDEAQRWLSPATSGERAKALFDHAAEHGAWVYQVLIARSRDPAPVYEYALIAVINVEEEKSARIIGFMD